MPENGEIAGLAMSIIFILLIFILVIVTIIYICYLITYMSKKIKLKNEELKIITNKSNNEDELNNKDEILNGDNINILNNEIKYM